MGNTNKFMKKINFLFLFIGIGFFFFQGVGNTIGYKSYKEKVRAIRKLKKQLNPPKNVNRSIYIRYLINYGQNWKNFDIDKKKITKLFKNFFNNKPYRVIWNWDIDGDGKKDYLGVEECPGVRRGVKRGILIDEKGNEKMIIDTKKGVHSKNRLDIPYLLDKMGHKENEVFCYSIGYRSKNSLMGSGVGLNERQLRYLSDKKGDMIVGGFVLQRLSKDLEVLGCGVFKNETVSYCSNTDILFRYVAKKKKVAFELFIGAQTIKEVCDMEKRSLENFRKAKKNGRTFKPPRELNRLDVEIADKIFEIKDTEIRQ